MNLIGDDSMNWRRMSLVGMTVLIVGFGLSGCEKYRLDRQMKELCKKDGGIKVYETVVLPPEMFDRWGNPFPRWSERKQIDRLGSDYQYLVEDIYLKRGNPIQLFSDGVLFKTNKKIIRVFDGKLLGQSANKT